MKFDLLPSGYKKLMRTIKTVSVYAVIGTVALLIGMGIMGFFRNLTTAIYFSVGLLLVVMPLLIPGFVFGKISQSTVIFADDEIQLYDHKGTCWRRLEYKNITEIRIEEVAGFFYGRNKEQFKSHYICFFLNGTSEIPQVSFSKLFAQDSFLMIGYQKEAMETFNLMYSLREIQNFSQDIDG